MGAPKQKWTPEEEAALKAGVIKHGAGKWRTILKDPEFNSTLCQRSNVDLKDKWRNMSVMTNGWGSRVRPRMVLRTSHQAPRQVDASAISQSDEDMSDARPIPIASALPQSSGSKKSMIRLDNIIMDAITNLKEPGGSSKTTIAAYVEDQFWAPPNFSRLLSAKLKHLVATGRLFKDKRKYTIPLSLATCNRRRMRSAPFGEGRHMVLPRFDQDDISIPTKSEIDLELAKMRNMTPEEAAAAAAQAVAEAEAALADAEEAAREAEAAEADAEAAQAFADAAMKTLQGAETPRTLVRA
ncbi:hypothetical protein Leryth_023934 [Lithospermum erythrorhizon]|nr:hypothetical protein Leryth_023934 [Lithospermum erythrorhizon]